MSMCNPNQQVREHYESLYLTRDCFGQDNRVYRAFIAALVGKTGIPLGSRVLDAGCGQGYLSRYLSGCGMNVWCSDLSEAGLRSLDRYDSVFHGKRIMADMVRPPFEGAFDLVFQRSCSLFNKSHSASHTAVVDGLADCVKVGGVICVVYNSDLSGRGDAWFNHTLKTFRGAFATRRVSDVEIYALNKVDCMAFGRYSFNRIVTLVNLALSMLTRRSFEIVVLAKRRV
jgi:SAM-dependent methyltransferase